LRQPTAPSLQGIAYSYPFVSRPAGSAAPQTYWLLAALHRLLDALYRLFEAVPLARERLALKREGESTRRMIDPWIERCRRALCCWLLALLLFVLGIMGWSFAVGAGKSHY
jgi:hypothetical protein